MSNFGESFEKMFTNILLFFLFANEQTKMRLFTPHGHEITIDFMNILTKLLYTPGLHIYQKDENV